MLFVSSWRDVGAPTPPLSSSSSRVAAAHSHHPHPSGGGQSSHTTTPKISPSLSVLRVKDGNAPNVSGRHTVLPPPPAVKLPPSVLTPSPTTAKKGSGRRRRDRRGGGGATAAGEGGSGANGAGSLPSTTAAEKSPPSSSALPDGVDYFLYLSIPTTAIHVPEDASHSTVTADVPPRTPPHPETPAALPSPTTGAALPEGPPLPSTSISASLPGLSPSIPSMDTAPRTPIIQNGITTLMDVKPLLSPEELVLEIKSQATPLRVFLLGPPRMMYAKMVDPLPPTQTKAHREQDGATPMAADTATKAGGHGDPASETTATPLEKASEAFSSRTSPSTAHSMPLFHTPALPVLSEGRRDDSPPTPTTLPIPAIPSHVDCAVGVEVGKGETHSMGLARTAAVAVGSTHAPPDGGDPEVSSIHVSESTSVPFFSLARPGESFSVCEDTKAAGLPPRSPAPVSIASEGTIPTTTTSDGASLSHPAPPSVPPPSLTLCTTSTLGSSLLSGASAPRVVLPPGIPQDFQVVALFAEESEAIHLQVFLKQRFRSIKTQLVPRSRSVLNASLVLKGLPSLHKSETILAALQEQLCHVPSYVRLHRSERGVFKNVMFIKYPNRGIAEDCKLILERFYLGARPLKVEFKKKSKPEASLPVGGSGSGNGKASTTTTPRTQPTTAPSHGPGNGGKSGTPPTPNATSSSAAAAAPSDTPQLLEKLIRELRVSTENEGVRLRRQDLRKEDLRVLKQLCQFYGMRLDLHSSETVVRVMRDTNLRGSHFQIANLTGSSSGMGAGNSFSSTHPLPPASSTSADWGLSPTALSYSTSARFSLQHSSSASKSTTPRSVPTSTRAVGQSSHSVSSRGGTTTTTTTTCTAVPSTAGGKSPQPCASDGPLSTGVKPWRASTQHQEGNAFESGSHSGHFGEDSNASLSARSQVERLRKAGLGSLLRCPGEEGGGTPFPPGRGRPV